MLTGSSAPHDVNVHMRTYSLSASAGLVEHVDSSNAVGTCMRYIIIGIYLYIYMYILLSEIIEQK